LVTLLLAKDAKVDSKNNSGMTPLMVAAQKGYEDICHKLIQKDNNQLLINKKDIY